MDIGREGVRNRSFLDTSKGCGAKAEMRRKFCGVRCVNLCSCKESSSAYRAIAFAQRLPVQKIADLNLPRKVCSCKNA
jgi:hypothetical protein